MLWSFETLRGFALHATDGAIGDVHDLLFDDRAWTVRYLVAETDGWLSGRKVLIAATALGAAEGGRRELSVALTREQIRSSPPVDAARPVSRQMEHALHSHYGWAPYWGPQVPAAPSAEAGDDPHLRSARAIEGYGIVATDGRIGEIEDVLVDDEDWRIRWLGVDTGDWVPKRPVFLPPDRATGISWNDRSVPVDLTRAEVKASPAPAGGTPTRDDEERLCGHYGRMPYWL